MDQNIKAVLDIQLKRTMENLEKNNMKAYFAKDHKALHDLVREIVTDGDKVGLGGSMTLFETGTLDYLRTMNVDLLDRYAEGNTMEDIQDLYRQAFYADVYFASSNAVTEEGELYNVDGNGNRVAAMVWGPKKVVLICGTNKIVKDEMEAVERNRRFAAPANAIRLNQKTPCATLGYCTDCNSPDRICSSYLMLKRQRVKDRIHVIFLEGNYGY